MSDSKVKAADSNYSAEQVAFLKNASPLDLDGVKAIEEKMGHSWRSIIAKIKSEGFEYVVKPAPKKRPVAITKAQLVEQITKDIGGNLQGLDKATLGSLVALRDSIHCTFALAPE